ncbi:hypothetical protein ES703_108113 [subsurface metagenome]
MKLLLDANLSWRLVKIISKDYPDILHIDKCDLNAPAKDLEIWEYAKRNNLTIVTNDEDFYEFSVYYGFPPNIVLLRIGNQSTDFIADTLIRHKEDIYKLIESEEIGLLEIY